MFLIYLAFLPNGGGWAVSLIWAMMTLPLADALQKCFQNLTSRIAGIDNEQMTNRAMGMGANFVAMADGTVINASYHKAYGNIVTVVAIALFVALVVTVRKFDNKKNTSLLGR